MHYAILLHDKQLKKSRTNSCQLKKSKMESFKAYFSYSNNVNFKHFLLSNSISFPEKPHILFHSILSILLRLSILDFNFTLHHNFVSLKPFPLPLTPLSLCFDFISLHHSFSLSQVYLYNTSLSISIMRLKYQFISQTPFSPVNVTFFILVWPKNTTYAI